MALAEIRGKFISSQHGHELYGCTHELKSSQFDFQRLRRQHRRHQKGTRRKHHSLEDFKLQEIIFNSRKWAENH